MKKLEEKELKQLTELINKSAELSTQIGALEAQKFGLLQGISQIDLELQKVQGELKEKYGEVSVNIHTGEITEQDELSTQD